MLLRNIPNILSAMRIPLLLCFCTQDSLIRFLAIVIAALSDVLDGFLARRWHVKSRFGTILDPLTDKIFTFGVLTLFLYEGKITLLDTLAFLSRDISLLLFTGYLFGKKLWTNYRIEAFICGKIMTAVQFLTFALLSINGTAPSYLFAVMALFGSLSLVELMRKQRVQSQ